MWIIAATLLTFEMKGLYVPKALPKVVEGRGRYFDLSIYCLRPCSSLGH